jgi:TIR domain
MAAGHAFLSYVREDSQSVDRLQRVLEAAGIRVWRDTDDLWPGEDWRDRIRNAITDNALAFIACFSSNSASREKSYQNEELLLAIEQLRLRRAGDPWLIPVRLDDCIIPDVDLGGGRTLASIQRADLFGDREHEGVARLVAAVLGILGESPKVADTAQAQPAAQIAGTVPDSEPNVEPQGVMADVGSRLPRPLMPSWESDPTETLAQSVLENLTGPTDTMPATTDRWKLTHSLANVPAMSQLGNQGFDHQAYGRPADETPPWVRTRAVVACARLGEAPGWQELRSRFVALLSQESIRGLIDELTDIPVEAIWRPRGTHRRSWLEADLTVEDEAAVPAASANLFLPEQETLAGLQPGCAQLTLHIDYAPRASTGTSRQTSARRPPYWRARFAQSLALPGELAAWLENQLGLTTSSHPAAQSGILLQDRRPIIEMVDPSGIRALSALYVTNQFTGWAVADGDGKTTQDLASQMMLDLSERVLHLDGTVEQMSGLV